MKYEIAKPFSLKTRGDASERWIQEQIIDDPSVLGLGDLQLVTSEKRIPNAGRLDLLLQDIENNRRYEVELMLGATDPSHIVRTVEYWDAERRRYPAYEHIAVLVAEDITTRFINFLSLLAGSVPLIAIQMSAIEVTDRAVLHFVHVLNQTELRVDDVYEGTEASGATVDRASWLAKAGNGSIELCDGVLSIAQQLTSETLELGYRKGYLTIGVSGSFFNWCSLHPKRGFLNLVARHDDRDAWLVQLEESGLDARISGQRRVIVRIRSDDLSQREAAVASLLRECRDYSSSE